GVLYRWQEYGAREPAITTARDVIRLLKEEEGLTGPRLKARLAKASSVDAYEWRDWWGGARDGWTIQDGVSHHTTAVAVDKDSVALARYRTFDAAAILVAMAEKTLPFDADLVAFLAKGVEIGELELFLVPYLEQVGAVPRLSRARLLENLRFDSQPDIRNS